MNEASCGSCLTMASASLRTRAQSGSALSMGFILCGWAIGVLRRQHQRLSLAQNKEPSPVAPPPNIRRLADSRTERSKKAKNRRCKLIVTVACHHVARPPDVDEMGVRHEIEEFPRMGLLDQFRGCAAYQQCRYGEAARGGRQLGLAPVAVDRPSAIEKAWVPVPPPAAVRMETQVLFQALGGARRLAMGQISGDRGRGLVDRAEAVACVGTHEALDLFDPFHVNAGRDVDEHERREGSALTGRQQSR